MTKSIILHLDMDCFFAAVEMRDHPPYQRVPLAVGGDGPRGVICTANYLARSFGVRSAMSGALAQKLCPQLIFAPLRFEAYREASEQVFYILNKYSSKIESMSLDEAYVDLSDSCANFFEAELLSKKIKQEIYEVTKLTCSVGISYCKYLAKIASDYKKPNGLFLIDPINFDQIVLPLPLIRLPGVGKKTAERFSALGLKSIGDLKNFGLHKALKHFGDQGMELFHYSLGHDDSKVQLERETKSISLEETFLQDIHDLGDMKEELLKLLPDFSERLKRFYDKGDHKQVIKGLFVKIKCSDFKSYVTVKSFHPSYFENLFSDFKLSHDQQELLLKLLEENVDKGQLPIRLLGLGVKLEPREENQLSLFSCA